MAKTVTFDVEARQALKKGIDVVASAVRITLGPKGRNVVLEKKFGAPTVTNDGVTIVREIELKDPMENMGAQLLSEVATKTNDVAGDGTTTATLLAQTIVNEGFRNVAAGANPMQLKSGIEKAVEAVVEEIKRLAVPVEGHEDVAHVAAISARATRDRQAHRRRDGQGRQGRRHHRRGEPGHRDRDRGRRGHAVRPRLRLRRTWSPTPTAWRPSSRSPTSSSPTRRSPSIQDLLPVLEKRRPAGQAAR